MSRESARRLAQLEGEADRAARMEYQAYLETLSDEELEALCADSPPDEAAALDTMSHADLERLANGGMSDDEWEERVEQARAQLGLGSLL